nr:MAG TPA: Replication associated protein [Microviridae sp.]
MSCFKPLIGWYSKYKNASGKRSIVFNSREALDPYHSLSIPCGQCIGCRLEKSRQWAIRCILESQLYQNSYFLTLTYNDEYLPKTGSLVPEDLQKFLKRLRRYIEYHGFDKKIRFFACGEYGDHFSRPHYHAIIYNLDIPDLKRFSTSFSGDTYYTSEIINQIWKKGYVIIGQVTFESCAYVARYVTKKITGSQADSYYQGRQPEFVRMSRRPGIGSAWLDQYKSDVYPHDYIVIRDGIKVKPPKYFDKLFEAIAPDEMAMIKSLRSVAGYESLVKDIKLRGLPLYKRGNDFHSAKDFNQMTNEFLILPIKEAVQKAKFEQLKRGYESE